MIVAFMLHAGPAGFADVPPAAFAKAGTAAQRSSATVNSNFLDMRPSLE